MNWHKFTLDEWLEQFGAWCDTAKCDEPDSLRVNMIDRLMVLSGAKTTPNYRKIECLITDIEGLEFNDLLLDVLKFADSEMKKDIQLLIENKVNGRTLRQIADYYGCSTIELRMKMYGAKAYIKGRCGLKFT